VRDLYSVKQGYIRVRSIPNIVTLALKMETGKECERWDTLWHLRFSRVWGWWRSGFLRRVGRYKQFRETYWGLYFEGCTFVSFLMQTQYFTTVRSRRFFFALVKALPVRERNWHVWCDNIYPQIVKRTLFKKQTHLQDWTVSYLTKQHSIQTYGGVEVTFHTFFTSVLEGVEWLPRRRDPTGYELHWPHTP
jgi:hypothetical protein